MKARHILKKNMFSSLVVKTLRKMFNQRKILSMGIREKGKCIDVLIRADEGKIGRPK